MISLHEEVRSVGVSGGSTDYSAAQVRPKEDVRDSKFIGQDEKTKKKSCFFNWEKYKAKLDNLYLSIRLASGREKEVVSFPFLSPGRGGTKKLQPTHHRAACTGHYSHISGPFQKLRATRSFLSASHSFYNEHHDFYNQEEKTIYIFKVWQGTPAFKMVILGHTPYRPSNEKILWSDPINSKTEGTPYSRAGKQKRIT